MPDDGEVWTLHRCTDGLPLADLMVTDRDFPWLRARVEPREELAEFLPLFTDELLQLAGIEDDMEPWERAQDAIRSVVVLRYPDGRDVPEFLLHLEGDEAWWRWNDEPFDEDT